MTNTTEEKIKNGTHILVSVAFKEQSGSVQTYTALTTPAKLGINVESEGKVSAPSKEEMEEALKYDNANPSSDPTKSKWFQLAAKYRATNNDDQRTVSMRIREAVVEFLRAGGLDGHPIDRSKYTFEGGPSALSLTQLHDDNKGTVTGHPDEMYLSLSASAAWGN